MVDTAAALLAILLLTLVTLTTRVAGVWIMSHFKITPRIDTFLRYMAVSVLISVVVPITIAASPRIWLAVGCAAALSIATRNALIAMLAGVAIAALAKHFSL